MGRRRFIGHPGPPPTPTTVSDSPLSSHCQFQETNGRVYTCAENTGLFTSRPAVRCFRAPVFLSLLLILTSLQAVVLPLLQQWMSPVCAMKCSRLGKDCCCRKKATHQHVPASGLSLRAGNGCGPACASSVAPLTPATTLRRSRVWTPSTAVRLIVVIRNAARITSRTTVSQYQRPPPTSN